MELKASGSGVILNEGAYLTKRSTVNSIVLSSKINVYAMTNCVLSASTVNKYDGDPATNNVIIGGNSSISFCVPVTVRSIISFAVSGYGPDGTELFTYQNDISRSLELNKMYNMPTIHDL